MRTILLILLVSGCTAANTTTEGKLSGMWCMGMCGFVDTEHTAESKIKDIRKPIEGIKEHKQQEKQQ